MKKSFSKAVIISLIVLTIAFTGTILYLMAEGREEPETLVKYWFSGFMSEMIALAGIKVTKVIRNYRSDFSDEDEEDDEEPVG